ncbi:MAG TPA: hypothetical protein VIM97_03470 [Actinomycetes bacterium]
MDQDRRPDPRHHRRLLPTHQQLTTLDAIAEVLPDGRIRLDEETYDTPSGAARAANGMATNGWTFWIADTAEGPRKLAELRANLIGDLTWTASRRETAYVPCVVPYPAAMPGAPYHSEAFSPLPGRCFRLVAHPGEAGPPVALSRWPGAAQGGRRTAAAIGSRPAKATGCRPGSQRVVPAGTQLQVDPAALPLHLIDLALAEAPPIRGVSLCATQALGLRKVTTRTADPNLIRNGFLLSRLQSSGTASCGVGGDSSSGDGP